MRCWKLVVVLSAAIGMAIAGCARQENVIRTPDDATHARIGVMTGSMGETLARQRWPQSQIKTFDDIMDAVVALKSGQLDTAVAGFPLALQLEKTNADLRQLPERLDDEETAIAVRRDDTQLLYDVNRVIAELKADGTLADMQKRWFKTNLEPYDEPEISLPDSGDALTIGVAATREPFNFVDKNGRVTGHDGDRILHARDAGRGRPRAAARLGPELAVVVRAPAAGRQVREDDAGVGLARRERAHVPDPDHLDREGAPLPRRRVPELAVRVRAPAADPPVGDERAGVVPARGDLRRALEPGQIGRAHV